MKTSLSFLPQIKQDQILHIVEIVKCVVKPEKIILYGSYAKNSHKDHRYRDGLGAGQEFRSDYDILVVTQNNPTNTNEIDAKISAQIPNDYPELNLEIHEIDYINEGLSFGQYFFSDIVKEGILLYDTGDLHFEEPRILSHAEKKKVSQGYFDIWFPRGSGFLKGVNFYISQNELKIAAFTLHQAAESFYYTLLLVYTDYKPKTHNLRRLRKLAKELSPEFYLIFPVEANKEERHLFDLLKRGYIDARYRQDYSISEKEVKLILDRVLNMQRVVERICRDKINSI